MKNKRFTPKENKDILEQAEKEAWSIGAKNIPQSPAYIGSVENEQDTFHYYKDEKGKFYYESEGVLKLQQELKEDQLKRHPYNGKQIRKWYPKSLRGTLTKK